MNNVSNSEGLPKFNKIQSILWPIHSWEIKKFIPMSLLSFLTIYIYCILRSTKDAVVVPMMGAEMISALKIYGVLPFSVIFMLVYSKLVNLFSLEKVYYIVCLFFLIFFSLYLFCVLENFSWVKFDLSEAKASTPYLRYIFIMIENWPHALFFVMAELWGSVMLTLMFWQFANSVTKIQEARRFYAAFGMIGQCGMYVAGKIGVVISGLSTSGSYDAWHNSLSWIVFSVVFAGILLMSIYRFMHIVVLTDKRFYNPEFDFTQKNGKKPKIKLNLVEGIRYIFTSKTLGLVACLVICYGISINLVEGIWKKQLGIQFPNHNEYSEYMGHFQAWNGLFSITAMIVGQNILRRFSWGVAATLTPIVVLVTGTLFFVFVISDQSTSVSLALITTNALVMSIFIGALQNIFSKSTKYALFDSTKEIAYIPLDDELRSKGKAAVDVVGARLGKSSGAVIQQILLSLVMGSSLLTFTTEIFTIFLVVMMVWLKSVSSLSKIMKPSMARKN